VKLITTKISTSPRAFTLLLTPGGPGGPGGPGRPAGPCMTDKCLALKYFLGWRTFKYNVSYLHTVVSILTTRTRWTGRTRVTWIAIISRNSSGTSVTLYITLKTCSFSWLIQCRLQVFVLVYVYVHWSTRARENVDHYHAQLWKSFMH